MSTGLHTEPTALSVRRVMPPPLDAHVEVAIGYEMRGLPPGIHAGLPSRFLTVIVSLDEPVDMIAMPDPAQRPEALGALAGGIHAAPASIRHDGTQVGVHLHVTPLGARVLFGMPSAELAWQVVPLKAVFGRADELVDRLRAAPTWAQRFAVLDAVLRGAVAAARPAAVRPELAFAFDRLAATHGAIDIQSLSHEVGWSRRHLAAQFAAEFGLAPKQMARVMRFDRARKLLSVSARRSLAEVAAESGYADQAHMTREWGEFCGSSPAAWLAAEEIPIVQDEQMLAG